MSETIALKEYEDWQGALAQEDVLFIANQLNQPHQRWLLRPQLQHDGYVLNPQQYVGVVQLPSGLCCRVQPKVPISSVFTMLAIAYDVPQFDDAAARYETLEDLLAFLVAHFAQLVQQHIDHGLYRHYIEEEANLAMVRGRIVFADDLRHNALLRQRTYCRFSELTWDIPENQIIRQVIHLLCGWNFAQDLQLQLRAIDSQLAEVTPTHFTTSVLDTFRYHRQNDVYLPTHQLCRLFLDLFSLTEQSGELAFRTFLLNMNQLFEKFVTRMLERYIPTTWHFQAQQKQYLDEHNRVSIKPDIVVSMPSHPPVVIDCKYKHIKDRSKNEDYYQMVAYCTALASFCGVLLSPLHNDISMPIIEIQHSPVKIHTILIDLSKCGASLEQECQRVAEHLRNLANALTDETPSR